jgi:hypothetical protein
LRWNFDRDVFGQPSYVGHIAQMTNKRNSHEAINTIAAVLGATLVDIDKSNQNGHNWVLMQESYYLKDRGIYIIGNYTTIGGLVGSFWYTIYPSVLFFQLTSKYPGTGEMDSEILTVADRYFEACVAMGGLAVPFSAPDFNHTSFDFDQMVPYDNGRWTEPDAAAGIAWLEYMAYTRSADPNHLLGADWGMQYLQDRTTNPFYEVLLPYGACLAARMNGELGRQYDVERFFNWCFDGSSVVRPGWGVTVGNWGGLPCSGLQGSLTHNDGFGFAMNTFDMVGAMVPIARYDDRFARAIGKWVLNAANASKYFYANALDADHQTGKAWADQYDTNYAITYEGLIKNWQGKTPVALGGPALNGYQNVETDFATYGASHVGMLGGVVEHTNVEAILQLDCLVTDFFHDTAYPTYLYYNPYNEAKTVEIDVGVGPVDLYDAVSNGFIKWNVSGISSFNMAPDSALVLVLAPAGGSLTVGDHYNDEKVFIDGVVVDYTSGFTPRYEWYPEMLKEDEHWTAGSPTRTAGPDGLTVEVGEGHVFALAIVENIWLPRTAEQVEVTVSDLSPGGKWVIKLWADFDRNGELEGGTIDVWAPWANMTETGTFVLDLPDYVLPARDQFPLHQLQLGLVGDPGDSVKFEYLDFVKGNSSVANWQIY